VFEGGEQIFVLSDGMVELGNILYSESVSGTAVPSGDIRLYIPGNPAIDWQSGGSASLTQGSGSISSTVTVVNDTLLVTVSTALSGNAIVQVSGAQLDLGSAETDTTLLGMFVNRVAGDDATMASSSHIRVGDPTLSSFNQMFVLSDPSGSDSLLIRPITITEGTVPVITVADDIELTLPVGLAWDPQRLPTISGSGTSYLTSTTLTAAALSSSNRSLTIAVSQDFDPSHTQLVLTDGYVVPTAVMTDTGYVMDQNPEIQQWSVNDYYWKEQPLPTWYSLSN
jgi:hypothetical protein